MRHLGLLLALCSSWPLTPALAQVPPPAATLRPRPEEPPAATKPHLMMGLTVSGGVSLGSFEAGYLYYIFETLKLSPGMAEPRIFTGASAGSANALLSLLASCSGRDPRPDQSLFYKVWIPVGLSQLYKPKQVTRRALFSHKPLSDAVDAIGKVWDQGLPTSCEATLGMSTTRLNAIRVELVKDRVSLARTEAKFVMHVQGRGPGQPPLAKNYVGERELMQRPLLPVETDGNIAFRSLKQVLLASGAFPLAFEPVPIPHCAALPGANGLTCTPERATVSLFVDGGVFDNQPLRLAVQLAQQGFIGTGTDRRFRALPSAADPLLRDDVLFVYVDPAVEVLPSVEEADKGVEDSTVSYLLRLFEQLVESSRSKELQVLLEDDPEVTKRIAATHSYFMPLSQPLYSFMGFFETDFRVHDFYLGMHSAHRWFAEAIDTWRTGVHPTYPEDVYRGGDAALTTSWAPYRCMRAIFDGVGTTATCADVSPSLRAGIQTSLDRIYARCTELKNRAERSGAALRPTPHEHCRRAFLGERPPLLPGMKDDGQFEFAKDESAMDHELRRLAAHGFHFHDMDIPHERVKEAKRYVAQSLGAMVRALGSQQERGVYRAVLPAMGRMLSQSMAYVPPYTTWHLLMGRGLEGGYSGALGDTKAKWLRGALSLELDGLLALASKLDSSALRLTPMLGLEMELLPLSSYRYQTRLGLRAGFTFSTYDHFLAEPCVEGQSCSRARIETYVAFVAYQLLRLQLGVAGYPPMRQRGLGWDYSIQPRVGVELDRP